MGTQPKPISGMEPVHHKAVTHYNEVAQRQYEMGKAKYGTILRTHNGRDAGRDVMEEYVDMGQYLTQLIMEHNDAKRLLKRFADRDDVLRKEISDAGFNLG